MYRPVLVAAPATTPVTLQEVKQHLRLVAGAEIYTTEDGILTIYLDAATAHLDGYSGILGRCLVTQTWRQDFDGFAKCLRLPLLAATIVSIKYRNSDGTLATISSDDYALKSDEIGSYVRFDDGYSFPSDLAQSQAVLIEFTAGYGAASAVPASIKQAILLLVGHWYINRETVTAGGVQDLPHAVNALVAPYRRVGI
jgi:uncharacterized phiE125 gp8 family phage protein